MKIVQVSAAIIIKNKLILSTQRNSGDYKGKWEFPGGKVMANETPLDALHREISEELDVKINVIDFFKTIEYEYPDFKLIMHCYLCTLKQGEPKLRVHSQFKWLSIHEINSVDWLDADIDLIEDLKRYFEE